MKNNIVMLMNKLRDRAIGLFYLIELKVSGHLDDASLVLIRSVSSLIFGFLLSTAIIGIVFSLLNFYLVIALGLAIGTGAFIKVSKEENDE